MTDHHNLRDQKSKLGCTESQDIRRSVFLLEVLWENLFSCFFHLSEIHIFLALGPLPLSFFFFFFSWRLITLQYCSGFLSYIDKNQPWFYMYSPSQSPLPPPSLQQHSIFLSVQFSCLPLPRVRILLITLDPLGYSRIVISLSGFLGKELKSLLVKEESENVGLKLNIQKTKIMASGPIASWQIDGETVETEQALFWGLQNHCRWWLLPRNKKTLAPWRNLDSILKQRYYFANKGPSSQGYGFSSSHV